LTRGGVAPLLDPALKRAELAVRERTGEFTLKASEEFLADAIGFGLEPRTHAGPGARERIFAGAPITRGSGRKAMRGADLAVLPRRGQTSEKAIEASFGAWRQVGDLAGGQGRQVVLHRSDLLQEPSRVKLDGHGSQPIFHFVSNGRAREEFREGCLRRVVRLADLGAEARFGRQLE
jgi:hypothetical protein